MVRPEAIATDAARIFWAVIRLWKTASRLATPATVGPSTCHCAAITGSFGVVSVDDELGRAGERRGHVQLPVPDLDDDLADADEVRVEDVDAYGRRRAFRRRVHLQELEAITADRRHQPPPAPGGKILFEARSGP